MTGHGILMWGSLAKYGGSLRMRRPPACVWVWSGASDPGVLQVQTDTGLMLDGEDIKINPVYAYDAVEELALEALASEETQLAVNQMINCLIQFSVNGSQVTVNKMTLYDVPGKLTGTIKVRTRRLKVGDRVLLLPSSDEQTYYLISKVVDVL